MPKNSPEFMIYCYSTVVRKPSQPTKNHDSQLPLHPVGPCDQSSPVDCLREVGPCSAQLVK